MIAGSLEAIRHESPEWLSRHYDLNDLESRIRTTLEAAGDTRNELERDWKGHHQSWPDWVINGLGVPIATASVIKALLSGLTIVELTLGGLGSALTLWGGSRFRRKVAFEREIRGKIVREERRVQHLERSLFKVKLARELQSRS